MRTLKELTILFAGIAAIALLALALPLPARAQDAPPQPDPNYVFQLNAYMNVEKSRALASMARDQAKIACAANLGAAAAGGVVDAEGAFKPMTGGTDVTRVAAIVGLAIMCNKDEGGSGAHVAQGPVVIPAAAPAPAKVAQGDWLNALLNAPAALLDFAKAVAPMGFQYLLGRVNARSNEAIQVSNGETQRALFGMVGGMHNATVGAMQGTAQGGFTAAQQIASQGFVSIAGLPPSQQWTFTNSHGINTGAGSLNYNPVTGSYNPVTQPPVVFPPAP